MKVYFADDTTFTKALKQRVEAEGDEIVTKQNAEMVIRGTLTDEKFNVPVIGGDSVFPKTMSDACGISTEPDRVANVVVSKWWDHSEGWSDQLIVGIPLIGTMNQNLGPQVPCGYVSRYINESFANQYFHNGTLEQILRDIGYNGFISMLLHCSEDVWICRVTSGIPSNGDFNFIEGIPRKVTDYFVDPKGNRLFESWTVGILVTKFPYPIEQCADRYFIKGLTESVRKHFWMIDARSHRKSAFSDGNVVGIATAWAPSLYKAARRAEVTCWNLQFENKQFRTDIDESAKQVWALVSELGLVGS